MPPLPNYQILLVEDSPNDVLFIGRAVQRGNLPFTLHHTSNGEEAISYLQGVGPYGDRDRYPFPNLIISNTKMPRMSGLALLRWIRQQSQWQSLPFIILSSVQDFADMEQVTELGVSLYVVKPVDINELISALHEIKNLLLAM